MTFAEASSRALGFGYSVFPVVCFVTPDGKREKRPLVTDWTRFAFTPTTQEDIDNWCKNDLIARYAGIGIPTGNGIVVMDFDAERTLTPSDLVASFPWYAPEEFPAWTRSGGGGYHLYTKGSLKNGVNILSASKEHGEIALDIRGDGGYIVGAGSVLWSCDPSSGVAIKVAEYDGRLVPKNELPPTPALVTRAREERQPAYKKIGAANVIPKGERHATAISMAMKIFSRVTTLESLPTLKRTYAKTLLDAFDDVDPEDPEYQQIFESAKDRRFAELDPFATRIIPIIKAAKAEAEQEEEMNSWGFHVVRASRINENIRLTIEFADGEVRHANMDVSALYSLQKFKEWFTIGTNRVLGSMKPKAFAAFVEAIKIEEVKDAGAGNIDLVKDALDRVFSRAHDASSVEEAEETLQNQGVAKWEGTLRFRLSKIRNEFEIRNIKPATLAQCLKELGAENIAKGIYTYKI